MSLHGNGNGRHFGPLDAILTDGEKDALNLMVLT